jgi:hypothetical protein
VPDDERAGNALASALPARLRDAAIEDWFDERVRPFVAFPSGAETWGAIADGFTDSALATIEERMRRSDGAPPMTALTVLAGWTAGYVAWTVALAVLRDGVLVRPATLRVLRHHDGYCADARLAGGRAVVAAGHPWSSRRDVATVADPAALAAEAIAEIARACTPLVDALARRSGRGRAGLWAQVADGAGNAAPSLLRAEPSIPAAAAVRETERLLRAPGAPWKHVPRFWIAAGSGGPVLVKHRRSCCLTNRCDRDARAEQPEAEGDAEFLARFGDEPPDYCPTCVFRPPEDVQARTLFEAERAAVQ